jgi:hypothetical protein
MKLEHCVQLQWHLKRAASHSSLSTKDNNVNLQNAMAMETDVYTSERVHLDWKNAVANTPVSRFYGFHEGQGHLLYSTVGSNPDFMLVKDLLYFLEDELEYLPV